MRRYLELMVVQAGYVALLWGLLSTRICANAQPLKTITSLPNELNESSGLVLVDNNTFISHNDGGDAPLLYMFDSMGQVTRTIFVRNTTNADWEDMAFMSDGRLLIGDFGNNNNTRTDLTIYITPPISTWSGDSIEAKTISFSYADQLGFPPPSKDKNFDCEAMVCRDDSIYLFSKNWSSPFSGYTKMYVLPAKEGTYDLFPRDSVYLGAIKEIAWVTSADQDDSSLYLLGSTYVWQFEWKDSLILSNPKQINLNHFSQKEALAIGDKGFYITDESTGGFGNLYYWRIQPVLSMRRELQPAQVKVYSYEKVLIVKSVMSPLRKLSVFDVEGSLIYKDICSGFRFEKSIGTLLHRPGVVWVQVELQNGQTLARKIVVQPGE